MGGRWTAARTSAGNAAREGWRGFGEVGEGVVLEGGLEGGGQGENSVGRQVENRFVSGWNML